MYKGSRLYAASALILINFFAAGCEKAPSRIIAAIGDRDSISMEEFKQAFTERYQKDVTLAGYNVRRKFADELVDRRIKLLKAYGDNLHESEEYRTGLTSVRQSKITEAAVDRYIYGHFITENTIANYRKNMTRMADVQNIIIFYKSNANPESRRTKEQAQRLMDSLHKIIDHRNFDRLAEKYSDDIDPQTNKGRIRVERVPFGDFPYNYENTVFNSLPNSITDPMDVGTGLVLTRVVGFSNAADSANPRLSDKEIKKIMKQRFQTSDNNIYLEYQRHFMDSLILSAKMKFNENNLKIFLSRFSGNSRPKEALARFNEIEQKMELVTFSEQKSIIAAGFLNQFAPENTIPQISGMKMFKELLTGQVRRSILDQKIIDTGYLNSVEFKDQIQSYSDRILVRMIDKVFLNTSESIQEGELRLFYKENFSDYISPGSIVVSVISSRSASVIHDLNSHLKNGTAFEAAFQKIQNEYKNIIGGADLRYKSNVSYTFADNNEYVHAAAKLEIGETSKVLSISGGEYAIVKVIKKEDPKPVAYEEIRSKVESDYRRHLFEGRMRSWLNKEKSKYKIVIYEQNISNIE